MNDVLQELRQFRSEVPEASNDLTERTYRSILDGPHKARRRPRRISQPRIAVAAAVVALSIAGGASAVIYHFAGSSPGLTAGFSAFDRLPPASLPSSFPTVAVERAAAHMGVSTDDFESRLRLVQTSLAVGSGRTPGMLYAYLGTNGTACVFLTGAGASCITESDTPRLPGVIPQVFSNYPGEAPVLVALVADNVNQIAVLINGQSTVVPIINNSIFAPLDVLQPGDLLALEATYADGTSHHFDLTNPL